METYRAWGYILIIVGVLLALWGVIHLYNAITFSNQVTAMSGMFGSEMSNTFGAEISQFAESIAPSKTPGFFLIVIGCAGAFIGTKTLNKAVKK